MTTSAWIEPGMAYEFSLYGGAGFSQLLARLLVTGTADPLSLTNAEQLPSRSNGIVLTAVPNPVPAAEEPGATKITWSTGDGSEGQLYVSSVGIYLGHDPTNSDAAWASLQSAKTRGAQYLLIPVKSFWWRGHCQKFREQVETSYPAVVRDESTCLIFDLQ